MVDVKVSTYEQMGAPELTVLLYEFKDGLNAYLKAAGSPHDSLKALIAWNTANACSVMPLFGQEIFEQAEKKGPLTDAAYLKARKSARRLAGKEGLLAVLDAGKFDALIAPACLLRGRPTMSWEITSSARDMALPQWRARPASPYRWARAMGCRWDLPSWAARTPKVQLIPSAMRLNRPRCARTAPRIPGNG